MFSPLEQFEISPLFFLFKTFDFFGLAVTNFTVFAFLFSFVLLGLFSYSIFNPKVVPTLRLYILESLYLFIYDLITANLGTKGIKYFPFIFFLFTFILSFNLFGLFPYSFTLTSQIAVAAFLSFSTFIGLILIALVNHRFNFFALFFPTGAPTFLAFLLVPIEVVSFFSRPFSLAIRLFANMTAGHVLLKILAGFVLTVLSSLTGFEVTANPLILLAFNFDGSPFVFSTGLFDYVAYVPTDSVILESVVKVLPSERFVQALAASISLDNSRQQPVSVLNTKLLFKTLLSQECSLRDLFFPFVAPPELPKYAPKLHSIYPPFMAAFERHVAQLSQPDPAKEILFYVFNDLPAIEGAGGKFKLIKPSTSIFVSILNFSLQDVYVTNLGLCLPLSGYMVSLGFVTAICSSFVSVLFTLVSAILPIVILVLFIFLELFVAILQAYVFTILVVIYLRDSLELH